MVFNDTTNKNGIIQLIERLTKLGDGGITNDPVLLKQTTADVNVAYAKVASALMRVDRNWRWDDTNYDDFAIATIDLVANQIDYILPRATTDEHPSTLYKLNRVRILVGGQYIALTLMDADEDESPNSGVPTKYRLIGNSLRFNCPIGGGTTLSEGLELEFQRSFQEFASTDTDKQPGFMNNYHDLLAYDASSVYLLPYNPELAVVYSNIFTNRLKNLQTDWAYKNTDFQPRLRIKQESNK